MVNFRIYWQWHLTVGTTIIAAATVMAAIILRFLQLIVSWLTIRHFLKVASDRLTAAAAVIILLMNTVIYSNAEVEPRWKWFGFPPQETRLKESLSEPRSSKLSGVMNSNKGCFIIAWDNLFFPIPLAFPFKLHSCHCYIIFLTTSERATIGGKCYSELLIA